MDKYCLNLHHLNQPLFPFLRIKEEVCVAFDNNLTFVFCTSGFDFPLFDGPPIWLIFYKKKRNGGVSIAG